MSATPNGLIEYQAQQGLDKLFQRVAKLESNDYFRPSRFSGEFSVGPTQAELDAVLGTPQSYNGNSLVLVEDTKHNLYYLAFGDNVYWYVQRIGLADNNPLGAKAYSTINLNIPDITDTPLLFNSEDYDLGGYHDTSLNTERLTVPIGGTGIYHISANVRWEPNVTGRRELHLRIGGSGVSIATDIMDAVQLPLAVTAQNVSVDMFLDEGDYIYATAHQNSGGNLLITTTPGTSPFLSMHRVT